VSLLLLFQGSLAPVAPPLPPDILPYGGFAQTGVTGFGMALGDEDRIAGGVRGAAVGFGESSDPATSVRGAAVSFDEDD
jgi:hypothetical protein